MAIYQKSSPPLNYKYQDTSRGINYILVRKSIFVMLLIFFILSIILIAVKFYYFILKIYQKKTIEEKNEVMKSKKNFNEILSPILCLTPDSLEYEKDWNCAGCV
jgi:anionic cell wall polymer biosynthesis LytR-Cps2A-Psr (LCP) family protein